MGRGRQLRGALGRGQLVTARSRATRLSHERSSPGRLGPLVSMQGRRDAAAAYRARQRSFSVISVSSSATPPGPRRSTPPRWRRSTFPSSSVTRTAPSSSPRRAATAFSMSGRSRRSSGGKTTSRPEARYISASKPPRGRPSTTSTRPRWRRAASRTAHRASGARATTPPTCWTRTATTSRRPISRPDAPRPPASTLRRRECSQVRSAPDPTWRCWRLPIARRLAYATLMRRYFIAKPAGRKRTFASGPFGSIS